MLGELALRFALGGLVVSAFSTTAEVFKPKTFSGVFGAAPSVAIVSLALAFHAHGKAYVAIEAKTMVLGGIALAAYASLCVFATQRRGLPVWLGATLSWLGWLAAAGALFIAWAHSGLR